MPGRVVARYGPYLDRVMDSKLRDHEVVREGDTGVMEEEEYLARKGNDPETGIYSAELVVKKRKRFQQTSGSTLHDTQHTLHGDPVRLVHSDVDVGAEHAVHQVVRLDQHGRYAGTYNLHFERTGDRTMTHTRTTRGD